MPTLQETAYPRLKSSVSIRDLTTLYTPTPQEVALAERATRGDVALLGFLVLLKTFQRLGYFVLVSHIPTAIVDHIAQATGTERAREDLAGYDTAGTRFRHLHVIRDYLQIRPCGSEARRTMLQAMQEAALTKEALARHVGGRAQPLCESAYQSFWSLRAGYGDVSSRTHLRPLGMKWRIVEGIIVVCRAGSLSSGRPQPWPRLGC